MTTSLLELLIATEKMLGGDAALIGLTKGGWTDFEIKRELEVKLISYASVFVKTQTCRIMVWQHGSQSHNHPTPTPL